MHKVDIVRFQHLHQHGLELFPVHRAAQAAHPIRYPRRVVLQQDHQVKAVFVDQGLHKRVLAPFVLLTERLSSDEIGINERHFIGVFNRKINVLRMTQRDFIVVGILQRHLIPAEVREDIIPAILPGAGGVKDVRQLVDQRGFTAGFPAEDRHGAHKERLHFGGNVFPIAERVFADLRSADVHKGAFGVNQHRLRSQMLRVLRGVGLFRGVDPVRLNPFLFHKGFYAVAPHVPAVGIRLHALFVKGMNTNVFLVFEGLQQPAQAIGYGRLLGHGAGFEQLAVALIIVAHDDMQFVHLATGALDEVDMPGMQRIKLAEHHADVLLHARKFKPQKAMQRFQLLRAGAFDFGIQQLA